MRWTTVTLTVLCACSSAPTPDPKPDPFHRLATTCAETLGIFAAGLETEKDRAGLAVLMRKAENRWREIGDKREP